MRAAVGVLHGIALPVVGYAFPAAAAVAVFASPLRSINGWGWRIKSLLVSSILSAVMILVSAIANGVPLPMLNILSTVAFALLLLAGAKITEDERSAAALAAWTALGVIFFYVVFGSSGTRDTFEHLWKYGIALPVGILVAHQLCTRTGSRAIISFVLLALATVTITLGFRSHGLVIIAAVLLLVAKGPSASGRRKIVKVVIAAALFAAASVAIPALIRADTLGESVRVRTEEQLSSGASILLAGRVEPPLSIAAILARPVLGWGSLESIDDDTFVAARELAAAMGLTSPAEYLNLWIQSDGRVSLHSTLFEAWALGGTAAVIAPLLMVLIFGAAIAKVSGTWAPLVLIVSVQGIWDLFFSPWGAGRPGMLAASVLVAAWAVSAARKPVSGVLSINREESLNWKKPV
jgi:hypothetical protein